MSIKNRTRSGTGGPTVLQITETVTDSLTRLDLSGEIDTANANAIVASVRDHLGRGTRKLIIDLSAVSFVDSYALGQLVACSHYADLAGRTVHVTGATGQVAHLIEMAGLTGYLTAE